MIPRCERAAPFLPHRTLSRLCCTPSDARCRAAAIEGSSPYVGVSQARVLLDGGVAVAVPRKNGAFVFNNVAPGTHLIEVHHVNHLFEPVRGLAWRAWPGRAQLAGGADGCDTLAPAVCRSASMPVRGSAV